jgi:hypothetical protein
LPMRESLRKCFQLKPRGQKQASHKANAPLLKLIVIATLPTP